MEIVKEQLLYLDTAYGEGLDGGDKTIVIPPGYLQCKPYEQLRISMVSFQCFCSMPNVNSSNNRVRLTDEATDVTTDITIPAGCYSQDDIKGYFKAAYPAMHMHFNHPSNGWRLSFATPHSIQWLNKSHTIFGFQPGDDVTAKTSLTSTQPVDLQPYSTIRLDVDNSVNSMGFANLTNADDGVIKQWNCLAAVPLAYEPYSWLTVEPANATHLYLAESSIHSLRLVCRLFDSRNNLVANMPDYKVCIRVETIDTRNRLQGIEEAMQAVLEYLAHEFMSKYEV